MLNDTTSPLDRQPRFRPRFLTYLKVCNTKIKHYEKINKSNFNSPEIEYKLGLCYLWSAAHNELAKEHLEKGLQKGYTTNSGVPLLEYDFYHNDYTSEDINYGLGRAYQLHLEFDKAIEQYNIFKQKYETAYHGKGKDHNAELKVLEHIIETANNGKIKYYGY